MIASAPAIHFDEFNHYITRSGEDNGFQIFERHHPEFGEWKERFLDLGHLRIYEHRANLKKHVKVFFDDGTVDKYVHHCMSVEGEMAAEFLDHHVNAHLVPQTFHNLFLPGKEYFLGMGTQFVNIHLEVAHDHYVKLLSDTEPWSASLKEKLLNNDIHYPGMFRMSPAMLQTIYTIFQSPLTGSLKKLLIEAKVHELVALQLHQSSLSPQATNKDARSRDLFQAIRAYLDDTFLEEHTLKDISRHFGINEFALKKGFRQHFDTTVFAYLLSKRLEHGQQLLLGTSQSIREIATTIGYKYPNHFSVAFKERFGYNPNALRKETH